MPWRGSAKKYQIPHLQHFKPQVLLMSIQKQKVLLVFTTRLTHLHNYSLQTPDSRRLMEKYIAQKRPSQSRQPFWNMEFSHHVPSTSLYTPTHPAPRITTI